MDAVLADLNPSQHAAVASRADALQVLAPPGSGKTKTLTSRVAYMIRDFGYKPENIICLTFTIKSSREMKERLSSLLGNGIERRLVLGTFHSVCRRYLVAYGHLIGVKKGFGILDTSETISIIKRIIKRLRLMIDPKVAQSRISKAKSKGLTCDDLEMKLGQRKDVEQQEIVAVFGAYQQYLESSNLLDFDDLLTRCIELLEKHPQCVFNIEALLVDEFQDTNTVQFELIRLFAAKKNRITTVGDPDQSIYGWRSADIRNLKRMRDHFPNTLVINLEQNYRSSGAILLAAQELIEQDSSRPSKAISPTHCLGTVPVLRALATAEDEARWTVSEILRLQALAGGMLDYCDFALLLRSASLSRLFETAMTKAGVPYRMVGGQRFFDRAEIKVLLDYLRVICQPDNNDALFRIANVPPRGTGPTTLKTLLETAEQQKQSLWSFIRNLQSGARCPNVKISKAGDQGLGAFVSFVLATQRRMLEPESVEDPETLLRHVIKKLDFSAYLQKHYPEDHESRWANVEELVAQASDYAISRPEILDQDSDDALPLIEGVEQTHDAPAREALAKFLGQAALATDLQTEGDPAESSGFVTISTIHAAKGLEFPVVFVSSVFDGCIPHSRAEDTDEERRLLYVAMTRAQGLLHLSWPNRNSQKDETSLSQFLSKKVRRYLCQQGPAMTRASVMDLARILGRECPSEKSVLERSAMLKSQVDDLWPLEVGQDEEMESRVDPSGNPTSMSMNKGTKRKFETPHLQIGNTNSSNPSGNALLVGPTTTMQRQEAFTANAAFGFRTASVQFQLEKEAVAKNQPNRNTHKELQRTEISPRKDNVKAQPSNGNLLSMWGFQNPARNLESSSDLKAIPQSVRLPLKDLQAQQTRSAPLTSPHCGLLKSPKNPSDAEHPGYVFLSSSPPADVPAIPEDGVPLDPTTANQNNGQTLRLWKGRNKPQKKTLGVRRSVAGWSMRTN